MYSLVHLTLFALGLSLLVLKGPRAFYFPRRLEPRTRDGLAYSYGIQRYRDETTGFVLRFAVPAGLRFSLREENSFDRIAKTLRLTSEPQVRDAAFDDRFYVDCEDEALLGDARSPSGLIKHFVVLQARLRATAARLGEVRCADGKLDVLIQRDMSSGAAHTEDVALQLLLPIVAELAARGSAPRRWVDRCYRARLLFVAVFLVGGAACTWVDEFCSERLIDERGLYSSIPWSLGGLTLALLATLVYIRPSPARHRTLVACLLVGLPGFLCSGALAMRTLNLMLPQPRPEAIALNQAYLMPATDRRGSRHYRVVFDTDDRRVRYLTPIALSSEEYQRLQRAWGPEPRRPAFLALHPGALGLPWVELSLSSP